MVDIREKEEAIEAINAILNNRGIAEIKIEGASTDPTVVEIKRTLKTAKKPRKSTAERLR